MDPSWAIELGCVMGFLTSSMTHLLQDPFNLRGSPAMDRWKPESFNSGWGITAQNGENS